MRMRTIEQAAGYLKEKDKDTAITKTAIRRLVVSGELSSVRVGHKYLISLENLENYLESGTVHVQSESSNGCIRRVEV